MKLAYSMNARGKQRKRTIETILLGSSETVRQTARSHRRMIQSGLHGNMQSAAEMPAPIASPEAVSNKHRTVLR